MTQGAFVELQRCRGCHAALGHEPPLLSMEPMPLAGHFPNTREEALCAPCYPLTWLQCPRCSLVQVLEDVDDTFLYQHYNYASSSVGTLIGHFGAYARWLEQRQTMAEPRVLEIGCNDGVLLRQLPKTWHLLGVDPSDVAGAAPRAHYELAQQPFDEGFAREHPDRGTFDLVTGSNCLAHISDLLGVFRGAHAMLRRGGCFVLEVHDLEATTSSGQWDTIYHEHKVEWSLGSLQNCLGPLGFRLREVERLALHGGLLRAAFEKGETEPGAGPSPVPGIAALRRAYEERRSASRYLRIRRALERGETVAAYGASGRANVWLNQHPELEMAYVVDDAPLRAGRFVPHQGFPIVPSNHFEQSPPNVCLITAWNYAEQIRGKHTNVPVTWETSLGDD